MTCVSYSSGQIALDLNEDGSGFIHYPDGSTAIAIATASSYQNSFYAFDRNRKGTLLAAIDEKGVGFVGSSRRKSADAEGGSFVLSKTKGIYADENGTIVYEWKWARDQLNSGTAPPELKMIISENITFRMIEGLRDNMFLDFECDGIRHTCDVGVKVKRTDNYLQNAKRMDTGRLEPQIEYVTLKQRTTKFNELMKGQRNKLNPKSENLSDMVKGIVAKLESKFDTFKVDSQGKPGLGLEWRKDALDKTLKEVPRIPICGAETGPCTGFGETLYQNPEDIDLSATVPSNLVLPTGEWKDSVEIRAALREANPPMQRTFVLKSASGRYSNMLVVDPKAITSQNPTGMVTCGGIPLKEQLWGPLKESLELDSTTGNSSGPLKLCLIFRRGDPVGIAYERVAELANELLQNALQSTLSSPEQKIRNTEIVRIEVGKDSSIISDLQIRTLPTFVAFKGGKTRRAAAQPTRQPIC